MKTLVLVLMLTSVADASARSDVYDTGATWHAAHTPTDPVLIGGTTRFVSETVTMRRTEQEQRPINSTAPVREKDSWHLVAPPAEDFTVMMPRPATKLDREVRVQKNLGIVEATYEVDAGGIRYIARPLRKGQPPRAVIFRDLGSLSAGVEYALLNLKDGRRSSLTPDGTLKFGGREGRQYRVRIGDADGVARVLETEESFYVLLALAAPEAADAQGSILRFLDSFTAGAANGAGDPAASDATGAAEQRALTAPANPFELYKQPQVRGRVSAGVLNGKAKIRYPPAYPQEAKDAGAAGVVGVRVLVDETGKVVEAEAISGHPLLRQAAVDAAYKWRFAPITLSGNPVKVSGTINYNFVL